MTKSLIFGANGQDGYYLSRLLLKLGHVVVGAGRARKDQGNGYSQCDISYPSEVNSLIARVKPDEIYNLAGMASPAAAEQDPASSYAVNVGGVKNIIKAMGLSCPKARLFQASSGYIFSQGAGNKTESSPFGPSGVYGKHKLEAHLMVSAARDDGLFAASGILFNHESPMRGAEFVTRKVAIAAAEFKLGLRSVPLKLGNLDSVRDWGFAGDYVQGMRLMLQADAPKDYVISTGVGHTVADLCREAFGYVGLDYKDHVEIESAASGNHGPSILVGDPSLIKKDLNWSAKMQFSELVQMMVEHDLSTRCMA